MPLQRKLVANSTWTLLLFLVLFRPEQAFSRCVYDTTASTSDGWFGCIGQCNLDVYHDGSDGTNALSCTPLHLWNYCMRYCADASRQSCPSDTREGNPINVADGSKIDNEVDFQTTGSYPLKIERFYNSAVKMPNGNFGVKWQDQSNAKIIGVRNSNTGEETYTLQKLGGDQISFKYDFSADNGSTLPVKPDVDFSLTMYAYGVDGISHVIVLRYNDARSEVYEFNLSAFLAANRYESKLMWQQNSTGQRHTFKYDPNGNVATIKDDFGNQLAYTYYSATNRVESITATPGAKVFRYAYDASGNLQYVYYPDNTASTTDNPFKTYHYENAQFPHHLTGITDENGKRYAWYEYNSEGLATLSKHANDAGLVRVLAYGGSPTRVLNANGKETDYYFTETRLVDKNGTPLDETRSNRLTAVNGESTSNCVASNTSVTYDSNGFKDHVKDGRGYVVDYDFNSSGQEVRRTEALIESGGTLVPTEATRTIETDWFSSGLVDEIREPGKTTNFTYTNSNGTSGRVATKTETDTTSQTVPYSTHGLTRTWTYSYTFHDAPTNVMVATVTIDGPRTDVSDIIKQYINPIGRVYRIEKTVNANTVLTTEIPDFTEEGLPKTIVDPNGTVTRLTYTPRGWVDTKTVETSKGNAVTDYDYDNAGQVTKVTLPNGAVLNYKYDDAHRLQEIYTNDNERIVYELDTFGNHRYERIYSSSGTLRRLVHKEFDDLGHLWKNFGIEDQELEKNTYDENGNLAGIANNNQQSIIRAFDGLNRLRTVTERDTGLAQYEYDGQDNLVKVIDQEGLTTSYVVDGLGRRIQETSPDRGVSIYRYDLANNRTKVTDARNVVIDYTYDALNRLKTINYPASPADNVTLNYDETTTDGVPNKGRGLLTSITAANGNNMARVYNELGGILRDIRIIGSQTYRTYYDYDLAGNLSSIRYPSEREVEYQKDAKGRVSNVRTRKTSSDAWTGLTSNIAYEPFGPMSSFTYGNGLTENLTYDTHYQPDIIQTLNGSTSIRSVGHGFNLNNELETIIDNSNAARSQTFAYDPVGRLTNAQGQYGALTYGYDLVGNRLSQLRTGASDGHNFNETYTLPTTSHKLTNISTTGNGGQTRSFAYSNAGNITNDGAFTYIYGANNRLTKVMNGPSVIAEYTYNNFGQRISKTVNGVTTHFHYDLNNQLIAESSSTGAISRHYVYLSGQLLSIIDVAK